MRGKRKRNRDGWVRLTSNKYRKLGYRSGAAGQLISSAGVLRMYDGRILYVESRADIWRPGRIAI